MIYFLINVINELFHLYTLIILVRVLFSWVNPDPYNPLVRFIYKITEPVLAPFRLILRTGYMGIDISPIIALVVLQVARSIIIGLLSGL